jgi:hypothetical protein
MTFIEAASFGLDKNDNYSSQLGHDDIMMTELVEALRKVLK